MTVDLFKRNFDVELEEEAKRAYEESSENRFYSQEELDAAVAEARSSAHDTGYQAGLQEGGNRVTQEIGAKHVDLLSDIQSKLSTLLGDHFEHINKIEEEMSGLLTEMCAKVFPEVLDARAGDRMRREIREIAKRAQGSPWLEIRVHPNFADEATEQIDEACRATGAKIKTQVVEDPDIPEKSAKAQWQDGRSDYDLDRLCRSLIDTISNPEII